MPVPSGPTPYTPHTFEHEDHLADVLLRTLSKGKESVSGPSKLEDHTSQGKRLGAEEAPPSGAEEAPPSGMSRHRPSLLFDLFSGSTAGPYPPRERGSWELRGRRGGGVGRGGSRRRKRSRSGTGGGSGGGSETKQREEKRGGGGAGQRLRSGGERKERPTSSVSGHGAARGPGGRGIQRLRGWLTAGALSEARIARFKKSPSIISHPDWVWPLLAPRTLQRTPTSYLPRTLQSER